MPVIDYTKALEKSGHWLEEVNALPSSEAPFWHCTVVDKAGQPVAAGFSSKKNLARKIATSEYLERTAYTELCKSEESTFRNWGLHLIPTACGFASGFDRNNTMLRSIAEAAERWVMSQWIQGGYFIEELSLEDVKSELDATSLSILEQFEKVHFYRKKIKVPVFGRPLALTVVHTVGLVNGGAFPGASAQTTGGNIWQHALIESLRHLLMARNNADRRTCFPDNKVYFFAENGPVALQQIAAAQKREWPKPKIAFHRSEHFPDRGHFLARTIFEGWRSWDEGPIDEFLY